MRTINIQPNMMLNKSIRQMPTLYKCFWFYLLTSVDQAGVWEVDWQQAGYACGGEIDPAEAKRIFLSTDDGTETPKAIEFKNGRKWFLPSFLKFQFPKGISNDSRWAKSIKQTLQIHGIDPETFIISGKQNLNPFYNPLPKGSDNPSQTLNEPLDNPLSNPYPNPSLRVQDKIRQDKTSIEVIDNSESSIISIGGMQGGNNKPNDPTFYETTAKRLIQAYGATKRQPRLMDIIRELVPATLYTMRENQIGFHEAANLLCEIAQLHYQQDIQNRNEHRMNLETWLEQKTYTIRPQKAESMTKQDSYKSEVDRIIENVKRKQQQQQQQ